MGADEAAPTRGDELHVLLLALGEVLDEAPALQRFLVRPSEAVDVVESEPDAPPDERKRGPGEVDVCVHTEQRMENAEGGHHERVDRDMDFEAPLPPRARVAKLSLP